ncbi:IS110 family transposase [Tychonema sp. LEGE 07203]|uniref:IS110 family transposase n=1 Tax=Tychonema sp. LEGE 07203 TaxID=1828671 RepID=UPI001882887A|nr:IS110 family transposase [Tychonema sp. LEGE 07203]MBE9095901.1 IS110 family transposase [Tychonema sp. LEGE 07203]
MALTVLGTDISKKDFHVSLLSESRATKPKKFTNNTQGFESLYNWLKQQSVVELHAGRSATSIYGETLAEFLYGEGFQVSTVNSARVKWFAKSELLRTKTESVDAALFARFCAAMKPSLWTPTAPKVKELQALLRRLESVTEMIASEQNRLETARPNVAVLTQEHLDYLQQQQLIKKLISDHFNQHQHLKQQRELLTSIPGIGDLIASILLAEIGDVSDCDNARQLAAYAGLTPSERSSGTSVKGKTRLSCTGNVRLRKALYMPAVVEMRHNPLLKAMSDRLLGRGKVKMQVIGALMRKLVHLAFGILKFQKPFDPNYLLATP